MDVFQDLIEELRDENLLEDTVIDLSREDRSASAEMLNDDSSQDFEVLASQDSEEDDETETSLSAPAEGEADFYRKRAMDEVSSLQMVEHVLSGIEREHMKVSPQTYDDLEAKKALHRFLQVQSDQTSAAYADAEFHLMRETETWNSALSARDKNISVSNLRRFCENSRPVLSSQALIALGRFYRNATFTEDTRSKFELVMTRLFSRETENAQRRLLFGRYEMIGHIKTLYANWASVALYSTEETTLKTRILLAGFEDRVREVEAAETFDQLIGNGFFDKVRQFKEAAGEMFFDPDIVAAAIDCNVRIGNKFIDLIRAERSAATLRGVEEKYGYDYDQIISEAAGKTLHLVELLKSLPDVDDSKGNEPKPHQTIDISTPKKPKVKRPLFSSEMFRVNKWLLALTLLVVIASIGLYLWADQPTSETSAAESAKDIDLESTPFKEFIRTGRATDENFYAITLPAWDQLTDEKKKEILVDALAFANQKGLKTVNIVNTRGRTVGYASKSKTMVMNPGP